jgi:hypothetical protein
MEDVVEVLKAKLRERRQPTLRPASEANLKLAQDAGFPDELIDL